MPLLFRKFDNFLGEVDMAEIKSYCNELGVPLDDQKAMSIVRQWVFSEFFLH